MTELAESFSISCNNEGPHGSVEIPCLKQTSDASQIREGLFMSLNLHVKPIKSFECREWLLNKHYAKRMPSISYAFGLYDGKHLVGVLTVGKPASPSLCVGVCGEAYSDFVFELNRLVINEGLPKNSLSFFVAKSLRLIKDSMILVSYADTAQGHHGYIYQATNWIYTGATTERTDIGLEDGSHSRHYDKSLDAKTYRKFRSSKHRYVYFLGKSKKAFKLALRYPVLPYPKGQNQRYNASYTPATQQLLGLELV